MVPEVRRRLADIRGGRERVGAGPRAVPPVACFRRVCRRVAAAAHEVPRAHEQSTRHRPREGDERRDEEDVIQAARERSVGDGQRLVLDLGRKLVQQAGTVA